MIRIALAAAVVAVMLSACGREACNCAVYTPHYPTAGFDLVVTEKDRAVTVHAGQKIELVLHARSGMSDWGSVSIDDPAVLRGVPTGVTAVKGVTIAGFEAVAPGTAKITATAVPVCSPGQACPQLAMLYEVDVTVSA